LCFAGSWTTVPAVFFAANHHDALSGREGGNHQSRANSFMNANLIAAASQVIPSAELLVNMVSRRVRQLSVGHRPMVQTAPGTLAADIALAEIIGGKLTWRPAVPADETEADVVPFPGVILSGKKAA
jgi:DNA-directed RNA polymerase subunit omega